MRNGNALVWYERKKLTGKFLSSKIKPERGYVIFQEDNFPKIKSVI